MTDDEVPTALGAQNLIPFSTAPENIIMDRRRMALECLTAMYQLLREAVVRPADPTKSDQFWDALRGNDLVVTCQFHIQPPTQTKPDLALPPAVLELLAKPADG